MRKNKIYQTLFFITFFFTAVGVLDYSHAAPKVNFGGYIKNETAVRIRDDHEILWCENIFQIDTDVELKPDKVYFYFSGRLYYDAVYDLHQTGFLRHHSQRKQLRDRMALPEHDSVSEYIRECYLDIYLKHFDIRLGKQQIVWGETDAFKMLDIINPVDLRHFNQDVWEDARITLWGAKIDWNPTLNTALQLVLIPDVEPMFVPPFFSGHPFLPSALRNGEAPLPLKHNEVAKNLSNMEWGMRWYQNLGSFNYTLNYFYHWTDTPGLFINIPKLRADLKYKRVHSIGTSWSWNLTRFLGMESVVLRFESVLDLENPHPTLEAPLGLPGVARSDKFSYAIALDKTFWRPYSLWPSGLTCMFHLFQFYILDHESNSKREFLVPQTNAHEDKVDTIFAFIFQTAYLPGEYLKPTLLVAYKDDGDWWIAPSVVYEATERITATLGFHIYSGPQDGLIGEFQKSSNVYLRIKYGF